MLGEVNFILVSILTTIYIHKTAGVIPKASCQYVFNVPTDLQDEDPKDIRAAITNLQEQVTILSRRLRHIETNDTLLATAGSASDVYGSGTNYVHWGRKLCSSRSALIYSGYTAKAAYTDTSGGINYICLPKDPEFTDDTVSGQQGNSKIYGVEIYATGINSIHPTTDNHNDLSCSVCEAKTRTQTLMIPGKRNCPNGWHFEYEGYVMAERSSGHVSASDFICVDKNPEFSNRGIGNQLSGYVLPVEVVCGIVPCPPYKEGHELSCVICSK